MNEATSTVDQVANGVPGLAVEANHLCVRYGPVTVLDDISFALAPGSVLGLVGRNGAGKTTLLRALLGLLPPAAGVAHLLGCDSRQLTDAVRVRLGYVAQSPELYNWLKVREQLALFGQLYPSWSERHTQELSARLDLPEDMRVGKLSPGERQRLAIVLAMQHRPDLLIFDEPVASLDPIGRRDFLRLLFEHETLSQSSATTIISSHLLEDLERVVTHLLFLDAGRVQLFGTRDELAEHMREVVTPVLPASQPGLLRSKRDAEDGTWRLVVDERSFDVKALPPAATCRPLGLSDLFIALNG